MVVRMPKAKREREGSRQQESRQPKNDGFRVLLEKKAEADCPYDCYSVTYDKNSQLQTCYYHSSREYTF